MNGINIPSRDISVDNAHAFISSSIL